MGQKKSVLQNQFLAGLLNKLKTGTQKLFKSCSAKPGSKKPVYVTSFLQVVAQRQTSVETALAMGTGVVRTTLPTRQTIPNVYPVAVRTTLLVNAHRKDVDYLRRVKGSQTRDPLLVSR